MSMWTLVVMTSLLAQDYRGGSAISVSSVPYFQSEAACMAAGKDVVGNRLPIEGRDFRLGIAITCVSSVLEVKP